MRWNERIPNLLCQCSSELHVISTQESCLIILHYHCVNALPSSTSFLPHPVRNPWFTRLFEAFFAGIFQNILTNSLFQGVFMSWRFFHIFQAILDFFHFLLEFWFSPFFVLFCSFPFFHYYNFLPGQRQAEIPCRRIILMMAVSRMTAIS